MKNLYLSSEELALYISNHPRISDAVLVFSYRGDLKDATEFQKIGGEAISYIRGDYDALFSFVKKNEGNILSWELIPFSRNQALELDDYKNKEIRIEPGAIIREQVEIGKNSVIMMNATVNAGVKIGEETMIDMGAVIGSRARIGSRCHIAANSVVAGVLEPPSRNEVVIEDDVFIGANSVVLEGVRVGHDSVIGAMSLVTKDVPPHSVVMGIPGRIVRKNDEKTEEKCKNNAHLR